MQKKDILFERITAAGEGLPLLFLTLVLSTISSAAAPNELPSAPLRSESQPTLHEAYGRLPLSFEPRSGSPESPGEFMARGAGYSLALSPAEVTLALTRGGKGQHRILRMTLLAGDRSASFETLEPLPGRANYLLGNDRKNWRTNVPMFGRVHYRGALPGIDVFYYGNQRQLEYDFVLAPEADPRSLKLQYRGADKVGINAAGDLVLTLGDEIVRQAKPFAYQVVMGERRPVRADYTLTGEGVVGFALGEYDPALPLVIDPVLFYSTYLGGTGADSARDVAVDSAGNAYVCGQTTSTNFPTANAIDTSFGGGTFNGARDAFVTKINAAGTALVFSTYLGGSGAISDGDDLCSKVQVDGTGNVYVAGETHSEDFPTANAIQATYGGGVSDAFVAKLNAAGSAFVYSTFLGGSVFDSAAAIDVDALGNVYVTGRTTSSNFPTVNALQAAYSGGPGADAFVTKINAAGSALFFSTYLGGNGGEGFDAGSGIVVDVGGNVYVTGQTTATTFPTVNAVQATFGGGTPDGDAFVTKINAAGSALFYSSYLGGSGNDVGAGVGLDSAGNAYVTGTTFSSNFPTANAFQATLNGASDVFITKFNAAGSAFVFSTYLGGDGSDAGNEIAVDPFGRALIAGGTSSTDFPTARAIQTSLGGGIDAFVIKFNAAANSLLYSTYVGGTALDRANGIALDSTGAVFIVGVTASPNFHTLNPLQADNQGNEDAFILKLGEAVPGQLLNISTRGQVLTGDKVLIGGVIITGVAPKRVLFRAVGDSMSINGIPIAGRLPNPTLSLHDQTEAEIAFNDNWSQAPEPERTEIEVSGVKPDDEQEPAILRTLLPGAYTAIVRGKDGSTGISVVEVYDLDATVESRLANLSTRGFVDTDDNLMIGGAIVGGAGVEAVVRAVGPSLSLNGVPVPDRLADPTLEIVDGNGTLLGANDNWQSNQAAEIQETGLAPADPAEPAIRLVLPSGPATMLLRGTNDSTGVALIEVFELREQLDAN